MKGAYVQKSTHVPAYRTLLAELKRARITARMSQEQLALQLGKPQSFVSKVESGERRLDLVEFVHYARAVGAEPEWLILALDEKMGRRRARLKSEPPPARTSPQRGGKSGA